jgi:hypothetical protein
MRVTVSAVYNATTADLWAQVVRYDALEAMMSGPWVRVTCPPGEEQVGDDVTLVFRFLGALPVGRWRFNVVARDDERRRLVSEESGTGVRSWRHEVAIDPLDDSTSRLTDTLEIDAGALTPLIAWFARREYARRHRQRQRMMTRAGLKRSLR